MSAAQRQEVAASAAGAVEQAVLRSLGVIDQQARALARQNPTEQQPTGEILNVSQCIDPHVVTAFPQLQEIISPSPSITLCGCDKDGLCMNWSRRHTEDIFCPQSKVPCERYWSNAIVMDEGCMVNGMLLKDFLLVFRYCPG